MAPALNVRLWNQPCYIRGVSYISGVEGGAIAEFHPFWIYDGLRLYMQLEYYDISTETMKVINKNSIIFMILKIK